MSPRFPIGALTVLLALPLAAQQQDNSAPPPQNQSAPAPKNQQKKPSTSQANPFPEQQSEQAAHQDDPQQDKTSQPNQDSNSAPDQPAPHNGSSPADQNPFPEAQSEKAAHDADQPPPAADKPTPGNSDSSSSQIKGLGLNDPGGSRIADGTGGTVLSPELGRKDTKVGDFYLQTGDYKGAYDRFAEATKVDPGNAEAVFGLAQAARHLNHLDEALRNYQLYLSALPDGPRAKDARKALKELAAK